MRNEGKIEERDGTRERYEEIVVKTEREESGRNQERKRESDERRKWEWMRGKCEE